MPVFEALAEATSTAEIVSLRKALRVSQRAFWSRILVTQSTGNRYEAGSSIPLPVLALLHLTYKSEKEAHALLSKLREPSRSLPEVSPTLLQSTESGEEASALRHALELNQSSFWALLGCTQSSGSRYEHGRHLPSGVPVLLRLILSSEEDAAKQLEQLRACT